MTRGSRADHADITVIDGRDAGVVQVGPECRDVVAHGAIVDCSVAEAPLKMPPPAEPAVLPDTVHPWSVAVPAL